MIVGETQELFRLDSWPAPVWCGQKVKWVNTGVYPKLSFMYEEGDISSPEICHKRSVLVQPLGSY